MKSFLMAAGLVAALASATAARANQVFDFTFSGNTNISGQLLTTDLAGNAYTIIGITGTIDGGRIAGLAPAGSFFNPNFKTDNLLHASGPLVDTGGFIVEAAPLLNPAAAHVPEQIQQSPIIGSLIPGNYIYDSYSGGFSYALGSFSVTHVPSAVPEPASLALVGGGLIALGVVRRRTV